MPKSSATFSYLYRAALGFLIFTGSYSLPVRGESPPFPPPFDTETDFSKPRLTAEDAARRFSVTDGLSVNVFAAEPDIQNPIAMSWDHQGRLWIVENYTYADRTKGHDYSLRDRLLIFEDRDGDGQFDRRTQFTDEIQLASSVANGTSGVWVMAPPQLLYFADADHNDRPDAAPQVMLDGFTPSTDNYHTFANGLKWGPDGWLYGRCGASSPGLVGVPGTPMAQRVPLAGGVWRYHPVRKTFEALCHGTTNPWGLDWNEDQQAFFINTVNGHFWHVIPGAHFKRPHSEDPNPYAYALIDTHADHYHWDTGQSWTASRDVKGLTDALGGGHAHSGGMVYLGHQWPSRYRGKFFTLNFHGRRVNVERLDRHESGYVAKHDPDILQSADPWFRGIDLNYGPDGAVYILDWSDTGECHDHSGIHRTSGRIYRVATLSTPNSSTPKYTPQNLLRLTNEELLDLHQHQNEWFVRQSRQILTERATSTPSSLSQSVRLRLIGRLDREFHSASSPSQQLKWLATRHRLSETEIDWMFPLLQNSHETIRAAAVEMLTDAWPLDTIMGIRHPRSVSPSPDILQKLCKLASDDTSSLVRLKLASALQRIPHENRLALAQPLASHLSDADDHNLPLMIWYGVLPLAHPFPVELAQFASKSQFPLVRQLIARRLAEGFDHSPESVNWLIQFGGESYQSFGPNSALGDILQGLTLGFAGRHKAPTPDAWPQLQQKLIETPHPQWNVLVQGLSLVFGDGRALEEVTKVALDDKAELALRRSALTTLLKQRPENLRTICEKLIGIRSLNVLAAQGLAEFDDPAVAQLLVRNYRKFLPAERPALIEALTSRPSFAKVLLDWMAAEKIPRGDLSAVHARQIRSFQNEALSNQLIQVWGELRDSSADKQNLIQELRSKLTPEELNLAQLGHGRKLFMQHCSNCHRLYGTGATIGPDLTGSGRSNLDYVLGNLVDPGATVGAEYRLSVVAMQNGQVLNGIVVSQTDRNLVLQTAKERLTIDRSTIEEVKLTTNSLMPDGLLQTLSPDQVRDLVAYIMHPTQVPLTD